MRKHKPTFAQLDKVSDAVSEIKICAEDCRSSLNGGYINSINVFDEYYKKVKNIVPLKLRKSLIKSMEAAENALYEIESNCDDIERWISDFVE